MLAQPTQSRAHGPCLVHCRLNLDTRFPRRTRLLLANPCQQRRQFLFNYVVIVVSPRIARDFPGGGTVLMMLVWCEVVERDDDDRTRSGKDLERAEALLHVAGHPAHLAVVAARQPLLQPAPFVCKRLGADDPNFVESLEKTPCLDVASEDHYSF